MEPRTLSNSLILILPDTLLATPGLLELFRLHFTHNYGVLLSWTVLESLGKVLIIYERVGDAKAAKEEMNGFVWEADDDAPLLSEDADKTRGLAPLEVYFVRPITSTRIDIPVTSLLAVPALSRNFLISPPGSPPVGWEQILEEAPNSNPLASDSYDAADESTKGNILGNVKWASELDRALRFLSVGVEEEESSVDSAPEDGATHTIIPPLSSTRPAVTLSTPAGNIFDQNLSSFLSPQPNGGFVTTSRPPPHATKISSVKATLESMLGRRKSMTFDDPSVVEARRDGEKNGTSEAATAPPSRVIPPTARPPTESIADFL